MQKEKINQTSFTHSEELLEKKNVVGVGIGQKNGEGELSIVVLVEKKESIDALEEADIIPEKIEGVRTDVIETGPIVPLAGVHTKRERPVFGGLSAIWRKGTACTLGAIVYKKGKPYALMNTHCGMPHWKGAKIGDDIIQPSGNDGGKKLGEKDVIGHSTAMYKELILDNASINPFDACLVELDVDVKELYLEGVGAIKPQPRGVRVGDLVTKSGRTTGVSSSQVLIVNATVKVDYGEGIAIFSNQIISKNDGKKFTAGGDSSSLVVDKDKHPVGQIFAGSNTIAIWCPIQTIMDEYDFTFSEVPQEEEAFKFTRTLKYQSTGLEVQKVQEFLKARGYFPVAVQSTQYFGRLTEKGVQEFQCASGLVCSGTPQTTGYGQTGPKTRDLMNGVTEPKIELYAKVKRLREMLLQIMDAVGHPIMVTGEYRTFEEQDDLYAQGRTKPGAIITNAKGGESFHNWQCAFDIAFVKDGDIYVGPWDMVGKVAEAIGLEWGGRWGEFVDRPHFQFTAGYSLEDFQQGRVDTSKFGV